MAEDKPKEEGIVAELTPEEQIILNKVLKRVESDIFHSVLKRFSYFLLTVIGILTLAGLINFYALSEKIVDGAAQKISKDTELQDKIVKQFLESEKDAGRTSSGFVNDLKEINLMMYDLKKELSQRLPTKNPQPDSTIQPK